MASGDSLYMFPPLSAVAPAWQWVAFTSGSVEPTPGDVIWGDTSNANAYLEILSLESGTWGGGDAAGYMLLSNWNGTAWTSGENFTKNTTTPANDGTLTSTPATNALAATITNGVWALAFDATTNEVAIFTGTLPQHYAGGGITAHLKLRGAAATGDMSFKGFFRSFTDDVDNILHTSFNTWSAPQTNNAIDAPSVIGEMTYDTIAFTDGAQIDSLAKGEFFQFLLMRDAQDATNDDMAGDASLVHLELRET